MRRHVDALTPDGILLIRVPNIEYWRLTEQRLRGMPEGGEPDTGSAWPVFARRCAASA